MKEFLKIEKVNTLKSIFATFIDIILTVGLGLILFFFAKVYDKTELEVNLSDYEFDKSVRGEFVRAVWESDLDSQEKNKIIMCGLSALKGEEI